MFFKNHEHIFSVDMIFFLNWNGFKICSQEKHAVKISAVDDLEM